MGSPAAKGAVSEVGMQHQEDRHWLTWIVAALALVVAGWLAFDGIHALVTGDYVTPSSGEYAGQLGPWAGFISAIGVEPRSTLMKTVHVLLGSTWIVVIVGFVMGKPWAWRGMLVCAVLVLWYLPFGTLLGAVEMVLLVVMRKISRP